MRARSVRKYVSGIAVTALSVSMLAACGSGSGGKATLNWYINPDGQDTLNALAKSCSTEDYEIKIQLLPSSATDQRTQLARRLAAGDSSTDLMSLDPVFVPEFANAKWLKPFEGELADQVLDGLLDGPADIVQWEDKVVAAPQWANTQVLWYRKSLAEAAGLDMTKPVTWDQVIDAAADNDGTVGVQANKYEAYVVWINSLIQGAGGNILDPATVEEGRDAKVTIASQAGKDAAEVIKRLADSDAAQPDFSTSNEGTSLGQMFPESGAGEFMTNWTFVYNNYKGLVGKPGGPKDDAEFQDLGWARYPQTVEGQESKPPIGGIEIGVGAYSKHPELAQQAALCVTNDEAQAELAVNDGFAPTRESVYDAPEVKEVLPADLLTLFRDSIDNGGPRPKSAYYSQISSAIQSRWHSPTSVGPGTPERSAAFLEDILSGKALL